MASAKISRGTLVVSLLLLAAVAVVALIVWSDIRHRMTYTVLFSDVGNLAPGAPVMLDNQQIGKVQSIRTGATPAEPDAVELQIYSEYRQALHAPPNTTAVIHRNPPVVGTAYVQVLNRGKYGAGLQPGSTVQGINAYVDEKLWLAQDAIDAAETAIAKARESIGQLERWAESGEGAQLRAEVGKYLESLEAIADSHADVTREKLGEALARGRTLWRDISRQHAPETADKVRESLLLLLAEGDKLSAEARTEIELLLREMESTAGNADNTTTATLQ